MHIFCRKIIYEKWTKFPNFTWYLPENLWKSLIFMFYAQKINNNPEYYMIFAWKMPEFYKIIAWPKIFFSEFFFWGGGMYPLCPRLLHIYTTMETWTHEQNNNIMSSTTLHVVEAEAKKCREKLQPRIVTDLVDLVGVAVDSSEWQVVFGRLVEVLGNLHLTTTLHVLRPPLVQCPASSVSSVAVTIAIINHFIRHAVKRQTNVHILLLLLLSCWASQALPIWGDKNVPKKWGIPPDSESREIRLFDSWQPFYWLGHHSRAAFVAHSWCIVGHSQTINVDGCWQTAKLQLVLRLCSGFYRSKDPTNSI